MDHESGMVIEFEGVWNLGGRDVELYEGTDFCLCGVGVDGSDGSGGVDGGDGSNVFRNNEGGLFRSGLFYGG